MKEKDYDAIAREIYRDEAISRMMYYDQQEDQCVELIAAIIRKHDEAEASGAPTDTDISHAILNDDMRGVDHAQLRRLFARPAPTPEKALGELYNWIETKHGDLPASKLSMQDRQEITSILAHPAPKDESKEGGE